MRLRLVLAFAVLVVGARPGWAQDDPPLSARQGVDAAVGAGVGDQHFPTYRVSIYKLKLFMDERSLKPADLENQYTDYYHSMMKKAQDHGELSQEQFCDLLGDYYGEHGTFPGIIVHR